MKQHEFIWAARNMKVGEARQTDNGKTCITLRAGILLIHDYKKKDRMTIEFHDDQSIYIIHDRKELETIYRLHLENEHLSEVLRRYCSENLTKIN